MARVLAQVLQAELTCGIVRRKRYSLELPRGSTGTSSLLSLCMYRVLSRQSASI